MIDVFNQIKKFYFLGIVIGKRNASEQAFQVVEALKLGKAVITRITDWR